MAKCGPLLRECPCCQWSFYFRKQRSLCPHCDARLVLFSDPLPMPEFNFWFEGNRNGPWIYCENLRERQRQFLQKMEDAHEAERAERESRLASMKYIQ